MKGDKVIQMVEVSSYFLLLFNCGKRKVALAKFVIIEIQTDSTFLQMLNESLKIL